MARITFAAGTSHTPMLLASDETLPRFQETDSLMKHRDREGRQVTYGDLLESADGQLRICKYVGFEPAQWVLPEAKVDAKLPGPVPADSASPAVST